MTDPLQPAVRRRVSPSGSTTCPASACVRGNLADLVRDKHVVGVTTNPTIFQKAISEQRRLRRAGARPRAARRRRRARRCARSRPTTCAGACDVLRPAYDATDGVDGRVSIEVDPRLAHDTERDDRRGPRAVVAGRPAQPVHQDPGDPAGLPAIAAALAEGISVNVTLIFSLERYARSWTRSSTASSAPAPPAHDLSKIGSVASFFVSRVDTEVDKRLDTIGTDEAKALRGKAAIANARLAYQLYEEMFAHRPLEGPRGRRAPSRSARCGPRPASRTRPTTTRCTSSTWSRPAPSTRCPRRRSTRSPTTATSAATRSAADYADAQQVLDGLAGVGIDYDDVVAGARGRGRREVRDVAGTS